MSAEIRLEGLKELEKKLGRLEAKRWKRQAIRAAGKQVIRKTSPYPSYTPDKSRLWYQRGHGTKWRRKDGSIGSNKSSESLGKQWYMKSKPSRVTIGNKASYAHYVHGAAGLTGKRKQTIGMERRGWKSLNETAWEQLPEIMEKLSKQIDGILKG